MSLSQPHNLGWSDTIAVAANPGAKLVPESSTSNLCFEDTKERIRKMFDKIELSVSSYDTAWVAMVPSPSSPLAPCFPACVNWLLENQLSDGSWGLSNRHPLLTKDVLSSTLACVLTLKRWGVGEVQMNNGLQFIESNCASITDEKQHTPIGFDIIFPGMIEYARDLNLNLPLKSRDIAAMINRRDLELKITTSNSEGKRTYLAYVSEGIGKLQNWEAVMKYQRKNGSLFNSPSTTAASLTQFQNAGCLQYLTSLLEKFGNAVPTVYPLEIYARLCMIDSLESLGIDWHFRKEIESVLNETYRSWLQGEEEIFLDMETCAMAFRILRANGYDVSSDPLSQFTDEEGFFNSLGGYLKDTGAALELYRASQMAIHPNESILDKAKAWTSNFLKQELSNSSIHSDRLSAYIKREVDDALKFPYHANLERIGNRRNVEHYNDNNTRILKTSYCSLNIGNKDFLQLAVEDFNICQSTHQDELKCLERWVIEKGLDKLKFARQKLPYCYFSAAATLFSRDLSDARISWAKNGVLTTVVDDFFDVGGSQRELVNLIELVERWDVNAKCCSEQVEIIFSALHSTICEIGENAFSWQERSVTSHIIEIWLSLLRSMLREADWSRNKALPSIDEYMMNGFVSSALGPIVLPALYFVSPKLPKEVVEGPEYHKLFMHMSTCGRLLNDINSFKRESTEGKLNAVSLHVIHGNGSISEDETIIYLKGLIDKNRRDLMRLVLEEKGSVVPRACKDVFWKMSKVLHLFYMNDDGFTSNGMINAVNELLNKPIIMNRM